MSMTDPIADFLTRIRNAIPAAHETVEIPASKLKTEIARILRSRATSRAYEPRPPDRGRPGDLIEITLSYTEDRRSAISRPAARLPTRPAHVRGRTAIPKVQGGMGTTIVSTSRGVMTGHEARQAGVGGEVVAEIW